MRIAIDARELSGRTTGVGRYLSEILREWGAMPEASAHEFVLCSSEEIPYAGQLHLSKAVSPGAGTWWEQRVLPRMVRTLAADVLFAPAYSGPIFGTVPLVVSIHDVSFAAHPEWFRWREGIRRRFVTRASARRAARILTLTEFSKREIVEHLGVAADRIDVIHPGAPVAKRPAAATSPLVLYVGSIFNRRHVPETIRGFERLARRRPDVRLTIVGDNRTVPRVEPAVRDVERVRLMSYVPDATLDDLYGQARAFVFLSEYEGFGLTPLEALARGVPVVVLDTAVAREVYGEAAVYVPSLDPADIEDALERALFHEDTRARVLAAAGAVTSRYTWRECARRTLDALLAAGR